MEECVRKTERKKQYFVSLYSNLPHFVFTAINDYGYFGVLMNLK